MSHSDLAIAGFYDHEQQTERRAPDWGGDDLFTVTPRRRFERAGHPQRLRETAEHQLPARQAPAHLTPPAAEDRSYETPMPEGRRTVTITGRPGESGAGIARRPARSLDERIAHRPERIASWICAMGILVFLLAILTSH